MRLPKRGEKGFTLIELLIVVAILGVLAAVVIPNVSRFIGAGEEEAQKTELANIQAAVTTMMVDNELTELLNPVLSGDMTQDMNGFPDTTAAAAAGKVTDLDGFDYAADPADGDGYVLFGHDLSGNDAVTPNPVQTDVNYTSTQTTAYWYYVDAQGTVTQDIDGP